nr:unnamed protein product [Callosobruchus analis]
MYFNFKLMYPKKVSVTLEMIQIFFKVHPFSGSKPTYTPIKEIITTFSNKLAR